MSSLSSTPRNRRDVIALNHLSLADQIANSFFRRFRSLLDPDDITQIAREALLLAASRCIPSQPPAPYLRRCITGALQHHLRDQVRLVRISRRAHESRRWPLSHLSLHQPHPTGGLWLDQLEDSTPSAQPNTPNELAVLPSLLEQLPAPQAAALRLTLLQGHSIRSAARQLGISATTLHRHRSQAVSQLRQAVKPARAA
jgi:RNA polymerase sigma-B factor